jgi:hypothetical protein
MQKNTFAWIWSLSFATLSVGFALCVAWIVPEDACNHIPAYIEWIKIWEFIQTPLGLTGIIGAWLVIFGVSFFLSKDRYHKEEKYEIDKRR